MSASAHAAEQRATEATTNRTLTNNRDITHVASIATMKIDAVQTDAMQTDAMRNDAAPAYDRQTKTSAKTPPAAAKRASSTATTSKRLAKKLVKPIRATWMELSHTVDFLKSAHQWIWPHSSADDFDSYLASQSLTARAFDVSLNRQPTYSLISKAPPLAAGRMSLYRYAATTPDKTLDATVTTQSTTQLQVRMQGDWMVLYEVNRTNATFDRDNIGVGLGLRYAF